MGEHRVTTLDRLQRRAAPTLLALIVAGPAAAGLAIDPALACGLLGDRGLPTRGGYQDGGQGVFRCASIGQRLPRASRSPDEVRFAATGDRGRVRQLQLELVRGSRGDQRSALDAFVELAQTLVVRSLGQPLPDDARRAIVMGIAGAWRVGRSEIGLEKIVGALPMLRLVIR